MTPTLRTTTRAVTLFAALAVAAILPGTAGAQSPAATGTLDGTWTIDHSIGSFDYDAGDFSGSWVGYRAQEELVGVGGTEAVGRTPSVDGTITIAGNQVTAADLTADLTTLRSNEPMRDGQLGHQGVQTDQFPTATFVLTEPIDLGTIPAEGTPLNVNAVGDLTLHGVTKNVTIPLAAVQQGDIIGAAGSITFTWGDFGMTQPSSMRVVSLANDVTLELQVFLRHDAGAAASPAASPAASAAG
ncbi:MAG: YceI family protein [Chloroflexota bacterium]